MYFKHCQCTTPLSSTSLSLSRCLYIYLYVFIYMYILQAPSAHHPFRVSLSTLPVLTKTANWPRPFSLCMTHGGMT